MKKLVLVLALSSMAAVAGDKKPAKAPIKLTDSQMDQVVAGGAGNQNNQGQNNQGQNQNNQGQNQNHQGQNQNSQGQNQK